GDRAAAEDVVQDVLSVLAGFGLAEEDAVDAVRGLRALLHGFVALENAGGFRLPQDFDRSYERLVTAYAASLASWGAPVPAR
ncbi:TetR-like C-terminal domain-containing protein, partial [Kineococcus glutinatus]|uniref:TetR-like C-terminal domain-containing protein n=1 Tax=Kineococcus glutinatus TaxID=1070872 RepID=UPI0031F0A95B